MIFTDYPQAGSNFHYTKTAISRAEDIQSLDALRRTHAMTVAMLAEANRRVAAREDDLKKQVRRIRSLENMIVTDEMTGLLNRRGFEREAKKELERLQRDSTRRGVFILLDLDGFKSINDTHGHYAGDLCLKAVGECLGRIIRSTDMAARLGGDEFAIFLANIDPAAAAQKIEDINRALNNLALPWEQGELKLAASLGFTMAAGATTFKNLYTEADRAMYRVKKQARRDSINHHDRLLNATADF